MTLLSRIKQQLWNLIKFLKGLLIKPKRSTMATLSKGALEWSILHLSKENDTDLFPKPIEIDVIRQNADECVAELSKIEIGQYKWHLSRRFVIPKDELSYRVVTQLDPMDSVFLSAIIKEYGSLIENKRIHEDKQIVFGNRFAPSDDGLLYKNDGQWRQFIDRTIARAQQTNFVLKFDIADFYNQIYHHTIENQLVICGFTNQVKNSIAGLLNTVTLKVSRGIPVGPHSTHLLAELALIPIDNSFISNGIDYCRYMDDFVVFCETELDCRITLNKVAQILDAHQRLILQRYKSKILPSDEYIRECNSEINFEPYSELENRIVEIIQNFDDEGPYRSINLWKELDEPDKAFFHGLNYHDIIQSYLKQENGPNFQMLKWFYRKLSYIRVPLAINETLNNITQLLPVINEICLYLIKSTENYEGDLSEKGRELHDILNLEIIKSSEYFQIALINLFIKTSNLNHFQFFAKKFDSSTEAVKRKIIFASLNLDNSDWLRENRENYNSFNIWTKRAFLIAYSSLPKDEKKFFYEMANTYLSKEDFLEKMIIKWGKLYQESDDDDDNLPF